MGTKLQSIGISNSDRSSVGGLPPESIIFGQSEAMQVVHERVEKVASANVPVLIRGESGSGKEVLAKLIHSRSPWGGGPFVKVSCPAIPGTLLESELFGYERGAFTGAFGTKPGRVELANRGTLFLDEIAELEPSLQAKLLQLLQDGQFCRIGAQEDKRVEVRVVCATNRELEREIRAGSFRQDLFYRINVVTVHLAPLRERSVDIPALVGYFLDYYSQKYNIPARPLSAGALRMMREYNWPGNVRELENLVKRYVILGSEEAITSDLLARDGDRSVEEMFGHGPFSLKVATRQAVRELERTIILRMLQENHWNRKQTARSLKISYRALLYKIKEAGLPPKRLPSWPTAVEAGSEKKRNEAKRSHSG
ncbi:MAG: sigma-54 interaction domain-containing protein [Terriglobia bacterium]